MTTRFWKLTHVLAGLVLLSCYAVAQMTVVCTPIGGVIVENFHQDIMIGEGITALGIISGDLSGGTFSAWPPPGEDTPAEGVITLLSGDTLRCSPKSRFPSLSRAASGTSSSRSPSSRGPVPTRELRDRSRATAA